MGERKLIVHNQAGDDGKGVESFVHAKLQNLVLPRTLYVSLKRSKRKSGFAATRVVMPPKWAFSKKKAGKTFDPWAHVIVSLRGTVTFPHTEQIPVGTAKAVDQESRTAAILMGRTLNQGSGDSKWFYETADVTFRDAAEAFVFGAGFGIFKVLRAFKLIEGRASKIGMRRNGLEWLNEWRVWTPCIPEDRKSVV